MELTRYLVGETILNGLPVGDHPSWPEFYQRYADAYNAIAEKCEVAGISIKMLRELVASVEDLERLSFRYAVDCLNSKIEHSGYRVKIVMDRSDRALLSQ